jgi:ankyrin
MSTDSRKLYQTAAYVLTGLCLCSTAVLLLFVFFGPKEGMEAMVILIPWYIAGLMHIGLGVAAIICVVLTGRFLKNSWILIYFLLFFSINGYTLAVMNQVDKAIARKVHTVTQSEQAELYDMLRTMKLASAAGHFQLDPADQARAIELVESGNVDLDYISPGFYQSLLLMAATTGDTRLVELMLKQGADPDGPPDQSHTPLKAAINFDLDAVVKLLLDNGADPNDPRYTGYPPLIVASREGKVTITRLLLEAGADPDKKTSSTSPALIQAAIKGHAEVVKVLLEHGADPNIIGYGKNTPLVRAVDSDCLDCVRYLLEGGSDGSGTSSRDKTPLAIALENNNQEMIKLLTGTGGPQAGSARDLFYALQEGDIKLFEALLELGVDPNAPGENGAIPLFTVATDHKYRPKLGQIAPKAARLLLKHGADPNLTTTKNETALHRAAKSGNTEVALILIENGADINLTPEGGWTPLYSAIQKKHNEIALALLEAGADPNQRAGKKYETTPLEAAARNNNPEMIKALFAAGAIVEPGSRDLGDLINHGAKHPEVLRMIVETGVDLNRRDPAKRYPLDIVVKHGNPESIYYLLQHGATPILPDFRGTQPFMHFVRNGQADLVAASIEYSPEILENKDKMRDGIYWAVRSAHPEVVRVLIEYNSRFQRMAEVQAVLDWAKMPPATEADKKEIRRIFSNYFSR